MIEQELIDGNEDLIESIASGKASPESVADKLLDRLNRNYRKVIEDNAELRKELTRLRRENEALINESDDGVDGVV